MDYSSFTNASWEKFRTLWKKWFPKVKKTFMGSLDEWNALTPAEQAEYDLLITPDEARDDIADKVTDGDMRPVTSNAVYDETHKTQDGHYGKTSVQNSSTTTVNPENAPSVSLIYVYDVSSASRFWFGIWWHSSTASNHTTIANSGLEISASSPTSLTFTGSSGNLAYKVIA